MAGSFTVRKEHKTGSEASIAHVSTLIPSDFNTRSFRSVIFFLNDIPMEEGGGGTRFYATEALKHLKQNEKGQWTCDQASLNELVTVEIPAVAGKMLTFDQTLVHEVTLTREYVVAYHHLSPVLCAVLLSVPPSVRRAWLAKEITASI